MNDNDIENEIRAKGLNAPRVTVQQVESVIAEEFYHRFPGTTVTVCCLVLTNGYTVVGESAAVSYENFDAELGRKIAREKAKQQIWQLEGYRLRLRLNEQKVAGGPTLAAQVAANEA